MASNGSFITSNYQGRGLKFSWYVKSQNVASNQTTIAWELTGYGSASSSWYRSGNFKVVIDGTTVYSSSTRIQLYEGTLVANGTFTMSHNSTGQRTFTASAQAGIYTVAVNCTGSGSFTLPVINRISTIDAFVGTNIEGNFSVKFTKYNNSFNTKLRISAPNHTLETIDYNNSNAQFKLSSSSLSYLYGAMANTNQIKISATLITYNGSTVVGESATVSNLCYLTNADPVLNETTYKDTNSNTVAITDNNQLIIQNKSNLVFTVPTATALKGASIVSYAVTLNGVTKSRSTAGDIDFGAVNIASNITATVKVTDSRGNTNKINTTVDVTILSWSKPILDATLKRKNNFYTETDLTVNATYSKLNNTNTVTIQYQYKKKSDSQYGALATVANNSTTTINLDNLYEWDVKVIVADRLDSNTYYLSVGKGLPIIFFDKIKNSIGFNCFPVNENSVESSGIVLDNNIYLGSQVLYDEYDVTTAGTFSLLGAYDYTLIDGLFTGINIPAGYEKAYRLTAQVTTNNSNQLSVGINNIFSATGNTWSNTTYRKSISSRIFKQSELTLEPTYNYTSRNGLNLKVTNSEAYTGTVYNITVHAFLVKSSN